MRRMPRWGMVCCVTLEWVALAVWVGGMIVLSGAVIPAVFNTFGGQDSGGMFLTRAFEGYHRFVIGSSAVLGLALLGRWWSGEARVAVNMSEIVVLGTMVAIAGVIILMLHPDAAALQVQAFTMKDEGAKKAAFEAFFRVLLPIRSLYVVNLVLGLLLMGIRVRRMIDDDGRPS